jgi:hypothetical protein
MLGEGLMKYLSRFLFALGCTALVLIAEDFWVKKPYTDWSEKDAAKLLVNSPWSHDVVISGGPTPEMAGGGTGRRGTAAGENPGAVGQNAGDMSGGGGGGGAGRGRPGSMGEMGGGGGAPSMTVHVRWQSALPIRQALVVNKLGHEKADSDQAKQFVGQTIPYYVVAVVGLPVNMTARIPDDQLAELAKTATLVRKDKDPIAAESAQKMPGEGVAFLFPKTAAITLDDKEVEFVSKVGRLEVKRKFKLKEMVLADKLEL